MWRTRMKLLNISRLWMRLRARLLAPTFAARVNLSPDSPTQMFKHNLRICRSRITFLAGSFLIFAGLSPAAVGLTAGWKVENKTKISSTNCFEWIPMYVIWWCVSVEMQRVNFEHEFCVKCVSPETNIYRGRCTMVQSLFWHFRRLNQTWHWLRWLRIILEFLKNKFTYRHYWIIEESSKCQIAASLAVSCGDVTSTGQFWDNVTLA